MKTGYQKYKKTSVHSASREKLLLMMYEGAIKFVKRAIVAIETNDIAARGENVGRAFDIIMELNNTLNHEVGADVSHQLEQLYFYMTDQLTKANVSGNIEHLNNTLRILETLYDGWLQAIEQLKKQGKL
ncbi:MAG: flagellar export chaperone FliS [Pseudobdellovibrionaceae bacterium]|nr:flagellar export chaperone FliS [Bdellovibrionales bacterium]USN46452.1 MAG: flagellar export chaperone FliS [Pseudobdellovibrionaceae bacterium]